MIDISRGAAGISLRRLLPEARFFGKSDIRVSACASDPHQCQPGDLFVARVTADRDSHEFAHHAIDQGVHAILGERLLPVSVPQCVVPNANQALSQICQALAGNVSQQMATIGVTGTYGKTSTCMLVESILNNGGFDVGTTNSLRFSDSLESTVAHRTTPNPPELADWMARMAANGCQAAVLEASSSALAQHELAGIDFDAIVLTNLRSKHLNLHGSTENYRKIKARIFQHTKPDAFAVLNADDPGSQELAQSLDMPALTFGLHNEANVTADIIECHKSEQTFLLHAGIESVPVRTSIVGKSHIYNCLSAVATGLGLGLDLHAIIRGIERVECVQGRMERIECGQPFGVFVDSANSPISLADSLRALRAVTDGRLICVASVNEIDDPGLRPLVGRVAERGSDVQFVTTTANGAAEPLAVIHDVLDGAERPEQMMVVPDRRKAIHAALITARDGDTVLIGGYQHCRPTSTGRPDDDRDIVRDWLYEKAANEADAGPIIFPITNYQRSIEKP